MGTDGPGPEAEKPDAGRTVPTRPTRDLLRLPSALIALSGGAMLAALVAPWAAEDCALAAVLGVAVAGLVALATCLCFAEMRSTAPYSGGAWHFGRTLFGVPGGVGLAVTEFLAMCATAALFLHATADFGAMLVRESAGDWGRVARETLGLALLGALPMLALLAWAQRSPATPRPPSLWWRRSYKWVSCLALTIAWGKLPQTAGALLSGHFALPPTRAAEELTLDFGWGFLTGLAALLFVMHAVPGDAPTPIRKRTTEDLPQSEHRRYRLPRGMLLGTTVCSVTASLVGLVAIAESPAALGVDESGVPAGLVVAGFLATLGGALFAMARGARVVFAMAKEGLLPRTWSSLPVPERPGSPARTLPWGGLLALGATSVMIATSADWRTATVRAAFLHALLGAAIAFSLNRMRLELGDEVDYGFATPWAPILPQGCGAGLSLLALALVLHSPGLLLLALVGATTAVGVYRGYARAHSFTRSVDVLSLEEAEPEDTDGSEQHSVLVAAGDADTATALLDLAQRLSPRTTTRYALLHAITVPPTVRISEASRNMHQAREVIEALTGRFAERGLKLGTSLRYARTAGRAILITARESGPNWLLLGWNGRLHRGRNLLWGRTLDLVMRRAPCHVAALKGTVTKDTAGRFLVPLIPGSRHCALALDVASRLAADSPDSVVELFAVRGRSVDDPDPRRFLRAVVHRLTFPSVRIVCRSEIYGSFVDGVLEEAIRGKHDLIILGAESKAQVALDEELDSAAIAARCAVPCLLVSSSTSLALRGRRWVRRNQDQRKDRG